MVTQTPETLTNRVAAHQSPPIEPNTVIASYTFVLTRAVGSRIPVITRLSPSVGEIRANRRLFEQTLLLLAVNARNSMPQGGIIVIESSRVELNESDVITHYGAKPGTFVRIAIRDTGCRPNSNALPAVANSPSGIRRIGSQMGAGIRNLESLMGDCDGFLTVDSYPGAGSTFALHFPEVKDYA